jgi:sucrose-phosphate synthase
MDWNREKIETILSQLPFLELQRDPGVQRPFKLSYNMPCAKDRLAAVNGLLLNAKCRYNAIYSHQLYLDILPARASKGKAIRYLSYKWEIPLDNILVCGDSGNDEEMLRGDMPGVVVAGFSPELVKLRGMRKIFFAPRQCAGGILDGIQHYNFDNMNPNQKGDKA